MGAVLGLKLKEIIFKKKIIKKIFFYILIDFQATLQPTKSLLHPFKSFHKYLKRKFVKYVKKAGFWAIGGTFRPKIERVQFFWVKGIFYWKSLIWACWPTVGDGVGGDNHTPMLVHVPMAGARDGCPSSGVFFVNLNFLT